jgi:hypothetical protein
MGTMKTDSVFTAVGVLFLGGLVAYADAQGVGTFDQLTLHLASPTTKVLPMEPLPITITLSNQTASTVRGLVFLHPAYGLMSFKVARNGGPFEPFAATDWGRKSGARRERSLAPGFRQEESVYLYHSQASKSEGRKAAYLFESPGIYRIQAILSDGDGEKEIESDLLDIQVEEPTGSDAEACRFLKDLPRQPDYDAFLLNDDASGEVMVKQRVFLDSFPTSRYARYVRLALGQADCRPKEGKERQEGMRLLQQVSADSNDMFSIQASTRLAELTRDANDSSKWELYRDAAAQKSSARSLRQISVGQRTPVEQNPKVVGTDPSRRHSPLLIPLLIGGTVAAGGVVLLLARRSAFTRKRRGQ